MSERAMVLHLGVGGAVGEHEDCHQVRRDTTIWAAELKTTGELPDIYQCGMIEKLALPCRHTLEHSYDGRIPIQLTLIHLR
jgi:hypothetical protein